jgi:hypothetical protein
MDDVRYKLLSGMIYECPACYNTGLIETSRDPCVSDCIPCYEGCCSSDAWVKERLTCNESVQIEFDNSDILF